jgi:methylated-DNA-[protein]-cysteine S-methyltransferase
VGHALGANPLHVLVPCHRFIAQDGGLVNFAAGLDWKRRLLLLEGSLLF